MIQLSDNQSDFHQLKNGAWSVEEDQKLVAQINQFGSGNWMQIPKAAGLCRSGKSCRLRWLNYLRPDLKRGHFTQEEIIIVVQSHELFGNKWSKIASFLPGRTDNEIKNLWHTYIKKSTKSFSNNGISGSHQDKPKKLKQMKKRRKITSNPKISSEQSSFMVMDSSIIDFPIMESYSPNGHDKDNYPISSVENVTEANEDEDIIWNYRNIFDEPLFSIEDEQLFNGIKSINNSSSIVNLFDENMTWESVFHHQIISPGSYPFSIGQ